MDFLELSQKRFTAKKFDLQKKISEEDFGKLKKILQLSPSSVNSQPWMFIWGSTQSSKKRIRPALFDFNWDRLDTCSHFVVIAVRKDISESYQKKLVDQEKADGRITSEEVAKTAFEFRKVYIDLLDSKGVTQCWAKHQAYIAMTTLLYGSKALGIDSTPIEGFNPEEMDKALNLDNYGFTSALVVTLGYDAEDDHNRDRPKSRWPEQNIFVCLDNA